MTLHNWLLDKSNKLSSGDIIEFTDGTKILIGDYTPGCLPSVNKEIKSIDNIEDLFI